MTVITLHFLGGGGLALFGTACLFTWATNLNELNDRFVDTSPIDGSQFLDDSCYRRTLGACFSTTLGSVLHELYHSFDLGHTEHGIMGRGFDNIYKFFIWPPNQDLCATHLHDSLSQNYELMQKPQSFDMEVQFKEEFEAEKLSQRLVEEKEKKNLIIVRTFEEKDDTYLTRSCATILRYHKWLNTSPSSKNSFTLCYDASNKLIKSTLGIRVVEIRRQADEMVLKQWTFEGKVLKFSYQIPRDGSVRNILHKGRILFVEDSYGNILKDNIM